MLYRINYKNFLMYMIDYFTSDEIAGMKFIILSARIQNNAQSPNVIKVNELYPTQDMVIEHDHLQDIDILEKAYIDMLDSSDHMEAGFINEENFGNVALYKIIHPVIHNEPVVLISSDEGHEDDYVTCICRILKKKYSLDCIDLNKLFTEGHVDPYKINLDKIHDRTVEIARSIAKEKFRDKASTREGRIDLIARMNTKEKIKHLKRYDIKLSDSEMKDIDSILLEAWCDHDGLI